MTFGKFCDDIRVIETKWNELLNKKIGGIVEFAIMKENTMSIESDCCKLDNNNKENHLN